MNVSQPDDGYPHQFAMHQRRHQAAQHAIPHVRGPQ